MTTGTTCATVLTQAIYIEGCKAVAAGVNVMDLRSGINMAVDAVIADLKSRAVMISTPEEITQVKGSWRRKICLVDFDFITLSDAFLVIRLLNYWGVYVCKFIIL